jgi:hypothetical protein
MNRRTMFALEEEIRFKPEGKDFGGKTLARRQAIKANSLSQQRHKVSLLFLCLKLCYFF